VNQMLDCFEASLKKVAEHSRAKEQEGAVGSYPIVVFDGFHRMIQTFENKEKAQGW
jgi:hypothetical protein